MTTPIQVAFHVGTFCTDDDRVALSLAQNAETLRRQGIELCANAVNEPILNEALGSLKGGTASAEMEEVILDALIESDSPRRLVMSRATLMGAPRRVFTNEGLMPYAGTKMLDLANVLPGTQPEFFMAIKNPATLIPQLVDRMKSDYNGLMGMTDPRTKRWAPSLRSAVQELRGRRLVVWCQEDMPMVFPEVLRLLTGVGPDTVLESEDRLLRKLLNAAGHAAMAERLTPGMAVEARRAATEDLLAEFALPERLTMTVDLPGWTPDLIAEITELYHRDVAEIAALPGVEFITA